MSNPSLDVRAAAPNPAFPAADDAADDAAYDARACRALMRGGSRSFFAASLLLPARVRGPASALYAYCRLADDLIDLGGDAALALAQLQQRLDAVYAGRPGPIDVDRALTSVVHRFRIPRALLDALLEGFCWDAAGRRYDTLAELEAYAARVAGAVGAMMALLMGVRDSTALARACDLGVAMQLTNIARDVGEDARRGRVYLPHAWLREAGVDADTWLRAPAFDARIAAVVQRLLGAAENLYDRAEQGIASLPRDCRAAIQAARLVYAPRLRGDRPPDRAAGFRFGVAARRGAAGAQARADGARDRRGRAASVRHRHIDAGAAGGAVPGRRRGLVRPASRARTLP